MISLSHRFLNVKPLMAFLLLLVFWGCSKEHSIETGGADSVSGTYAFTEGGTVYRGNIDSTYTIEGNSINELHIIGHPSGGDDEFHLILYSASTFGTGIYQAATFNTAFDYGVQPTLLYTAGQPIGDFSVNVTTSTESMITGTFLGTALKNGADIVNITDGIFKVILPQKPAEPTSEGVLGNESGACQPVELSGTYRQGVALNGSNTVKVQVNVSTPGTYSIFTDPVNGVTFSGTGIFSTIGQSTIMLTGAGTSTAAGDQNFVLHFGNSTCGFTVTFLEEIAASNDYFPTTTGSWWELQTGAGEVANYKVSDQFTTFNGQSYKIIGAYENPDDQDFAYEVYHIRKNAGNYYDLTDYDEFSETGTPQLLETIILKDNVPAGTSWNGPIFNITQEGVTASANMKFTVTDKGVPVAMGSFNFPDVIKVKSEIVINGVSTDYMEQWYAHNVGPIYIKYPDGTTLDLTAYNIFTP